MSLLSAPKAAYGAVRVSIAILLLALAAPAAAQKRSISHEDVWLSKRISAPAVSPDGRTAVFQVVEPAYDDRQVSDLWIVPTDGSEPPRRLTSSRGGESGARWSPDGRRVAFSARREGDDVAQIYVIDVANGGEAQRVTTLTTGARAPHWRPDGKAILFTSDIYPGARSEEENKKAADERKNRKWTARVYDSFPIRDWDRWLDDRRPTLMVQVLDPAGKARDILAGSRLASGPGFAGHWGSGSDNIPAAWTPDGTGVVFSVTTNRHEAAFSEVVHALWLVNVGGGEPKRLTPDNDSYDDPEFSRDGKTLFATTSANNEHVYNLSRLVRWSWPAVGGRTVITGGFDRSVASFAPGPDGKAVFLLAEDQGHRRLFTVDAGGGPTREVGSLTAGSFATLAVDGEGTPVIVATWESAVNPPEVVRIDAASGNRSLLSKFNVDRAAQIDWQPLQEFWFTSRKGRRIHNFIVLPPNFDPATKYPLFVLLHGGPHNMWTDQFVIRWNYHLHAQPGYVVLLTNYTGSTGFGERFAQAIQRDPLQTPGEEVNEAADGAIRKYSFIDPTRQAAGGASYGGHLANWLAVTTTRYKALVSHAGLFDQAQQWGTSDVVFSRERNAGGPPWEKAAVWTEQNPLSRAGNLKTPMLVTVGERDFRVPMNNAIQLWSALQRMKVPGKLIVFPDENHWVLKGENSRFFYAQIHAWLAKWFDTPASTAAR